jgi:hypothetical protein
MHDRADDAAGKTRTQDEHADNGDFEPADDMWLEFSVSEADMRTLEGEVFHLISLKNPTVRRDE